LKLFPVKILDPHYFYFLIKLVQKLAHRYKNLVAKMTS